MRQLIQKKLDQGESRQQIMDYFVQNYGVGILREPPKHGFMQALWLGPVVGIVIGAILLTAFLLQRRGRTPGPRPPEDAASEVELRAYEERLLRDLDRLDAGA